MPEVASREQAHAWDLRGAWAGRRPVVVRLDGERVEVDRLAGYVEHVSPSGAYAVVDDLDRGEVHFPCAVVLAVIRPHFHEPGAADLLAARPSRGPALAVPPGQLAFELGDRRPEPGEA